MPVALSRVRGLKPEEKREEMLSMVALSRVRGLKPLEVEKANRRYGVALSRVRGLKLKESCLDLKGLVVALSRVRGLKPFQFFRFILANGRTLTSAWIETLCMAWNRECFLVALSRVRGLKQPIPVLPGPGQESHSHECVD